MVSNPSCKLDILIWTRFKVLQVIARHKIGTIIVRHRIHKVCQVLVSTHLYLRHICRLNCSPSHLIIRISSRTIWPHLLPRDLLVGMHRTWPHLRDIGCRTDCTDSAAMTLLARHQSTNLHDRCQGKALLKFVLQRMFANFAADNNQIIRVVVPIMNKIFRFSCIFTLSRFDEASKTIF